MLKLNYCGWIFKSIFLLLFTTNVGLSQSINITPTITPPYPIHLEDIVTFDYGIIVTLTNFSGTNENIKLVASLEGDNGVSIVIKDEFRPAFPIQVAPNATVVLTQGDMQRLYSNITQNNILYNGIDESTLLQTEKLPEGIYQLCIKALDYTTGELKSIESSGCTSLFITDYDPPIITSPLNKTYVNPLQPQSVMFSWISSGLPQFTRYKFELVDMTLNNLLDPNDAFGNISIILHYQKQNLLQPNLFYDISMPGLLENHEYAVRVTAYDPSQNIAFKNNGQSEVISFKYQKQGSINQDFDLDVNAGGNDVQFAQNICNYLSLPADKTAVTDINPYDILKIGSHDLKVFEISWSGDKLSGTGKIINSYFKVPILVKFKDLKVNAAHQVFDGVAQAKADDNIPSQWINDLGNVDFGGSDITNVVQGLQNGNDDKIIEYPYSNLDSVGLGVPIGLNREIAGTDQLLAIVGMSFSPLGAGLNAIGEFELPKYDKRIQVAASGVCFDNTGFKKDAFLYLIEDIELNENGKITLKLDKGIEADIPEGTFITMESDGFKEASINGALKIDDSLIKPVDENQNQVTVDFNILVDNPKSFIINNLTISPFQITKFPGFEVTVNNASFDFSDTQNPNEIQFPTENYNGNEGTLWQGIYIENCSIKLPEKLHKNSVVEASNFVMDKKGFSGIIESGQLFNTEEGKLGSKQWKWSMEDLYVEVLENNLNTAKFEGDVRVPITKDDFYLSYETTISVEDDELNYNFNITNDEKIHFPAIIAKGEISPQTRIEIKNTNGVLEPEFHLFGHLSLNRSFAFNKNNDGLLPSLSLDSIIVEDIIVDKNGLSLGPDGAVSFSYDADQRTFNGFDINIDSVAFKTNQIYLGMSVDLLGEDNAVSATGGFDINVKYDEEDDYMMRFDGIGFTELSIDGDISVASVKGSIKLKNEDANWGTGFEGKLAIGLKLGANPDETIEGGERDADGNVSAGVKIHTLFGNMPTKGTVKSYKYFYFLGEFFLKKGIPLTATLNMYGLKGGIFLNMKQEQGADIYSKPKPFKAANNDLNMGLIAGLDIGLKDVRAFHAKPQLMAEFSTKTGLKKLVIQGQAYAMTDWQPTFEPYAEGTSPVSIEMEANFDFENKIFKFNSEINAAYPLQSKKPLVSANGTVDMLIDHKKDIWYFKAGVPTSMQEQESNPNIGVNVANMYTKQHYIMAGKGLPTMEPIPQAILKNLSKPYKTNRTGVENSNNLKFAFGSQFSFDSKDLKAWIFYAKFQILFGYDIMITKNYNPACGIGKNNWYMRGQAYGKFAADIGIEAKIFGKIRKAPLTYVDVSTLVEIGLVNPSGIEAVVKGEANFMGIIKGDFEFEVKQGEICEEYLPDSDIGLDDLVYIQDCSAKGNNVNVFHNPEISLLFKANNKSYSLKQIVDGNTSTRYFKFPIKSIKLMIDDTNSPENGKVLAEYGKSKLDGSFELKKAGDLLAYTSKYLLPAKTKFKLDIQIEVKEKINGKWTSTKDVKNTSKSYSFTSGEKPDHIVKNNIEFKYPADGQRYYLQDERSKEAFIKLKKNQGDLFEFNAENPGEVLVKFIPVGKGEVISGSFIKYDYATNTVHFKHDRLVANKKYVCQIYRKMKGHVPLHNDLPLADEDFKSKMTAKFKLLSNMKLSDKESAIYEFVFGVSKYNTLPEKLERMQIQNESRLVTIKYAFHDNSIASSVVFKATEEGFDKADRIHLDPQWLIAEGSYYLNKFGKDAGYYYRKDYLNPVIYDFFNEEIKPYRNNPHEWEVNSKMTLVNPEPLISQTEINNILNKPLNPGLQIKDAPGTKKVQFRIDGLTEANEKYNKLREIIVDPEFIKTLIHVKNDYPLVIQIFNWLAINKEFKPIDINQNNSMIIWRENLESGQYQYSKKWKVFKHIK